MGFQNDLKICMWFFQNPEIIFYYFFRIFNLDIFWVLILQKYIGSRYLVPLTPPAVFGRSIWNFTDALRMVWKYVCGFFQNPEIIFYHFLHVLYLDIFWVLILQKSIGSRYLVPLTPPTVFDRSFWHFTWAFRMAWKYAGESFRILKYFFYYFFRIFNLDIFWVLILQKCIGCRYLVPLTPPTGFGRSFWTLQGLLGLPEDMHVFFSESWNNFLPLFLHF